MNITEKIILMLDIAGHRGMTGYQMASIVGTIKYAVFWTSEIHRLEKVGAIYSEWEIMKPPRHRRYWLARYKKQR